MSDIEQPEPDIVRSARDVWDTYHQMMLAKGINIEEALAAWTAEQRQRLASPPGARTNFDELCKAGCVAHALALTIALIRLSPKLSAFANVMLGDPSKREKTLRSLENASAAFEDIFGVALALEDEDTRTHFVKLGRLPPSRLVSEIRLYAKVLKLAERLPYDLEVDSLTELTKYLLAGYVERATGRFCDKHVSVLIGDIVGSADYNEVAQRMWRYRNYKRLKKNFFGLPELLFDLSFVVTRRT
jgi:hypothetical protein